jgi:hypothetical protein
VFILHNAFEHLEVPGAEPFTYSELITCVPAIKLRDGIQYRRIKG